MRGGYRPGLGWWLAALGLLLLGAAFAGRAWWKAGAEFRRPLAEIALPGPAHRAVDCAAIPREGLMVALLLGQSNSANHAQTKATAGPRAWSWFDGRCYEAADPLPGASGQGGSVWTRFAPLALASGRHAGVLLVPLGVDTTSVALWARHPVLVGRLEVAARGLRDAGLPVTHVLWHQGEADSYKQTSAAAYRRDFIVVLERLRALGVTAPMWVAQATACQQRRNPAVRALQVELPKTLAGVLAGPDLDERFTPQWRYDGCHFSTEGAAVAAADWWRALERAAMPAPARPEPGAPAAGAGGRS